MQIPCHRQSCPNVCWTLACPAQRCPCTSQKRIWNLLHSSNISICNAPDLFDSSAADIIWHRSSKRTDDFLTEKQVFKLDSWVLKLGEQLLAWAQLFPLAGSCSHSGFKLQDLDQLFFANNGRPALSTFLMFVCAFRIPLHTLIRCSFSLQLST